MAKIPFGVALVAFLAAPTLAQKVYIDHDTSYDRSQIRTFSWADTPETSLEGRDRLMHSRIVNSIEHYLGQEGLRQVESDPDVYVTYHANAEDELSLDTDIWGYAYPSGWYWDPYWPGYYGSYWTSSAMAYRYTQGTLVVDIWDAATKQLVWRGSASGVVPEKRAKLEKKIYKAIKKMVAKWHSIRRKSARSER